jgi:alanyl-tRNA synthetase
MTDRLYYDDPLALDFDARVISHSSFDGRPSLLLDRTAFYPESGGQMADHGKLGGLPVIDVQIDESGQLHHLVEGALPQPETMVQGTVDWRRRRTHMALHTGQHMLSRALFDELGATTLSSRLGETRCTIDVDIAPPSDAELDSCEKLVNSLVDQSLPIRSYFPSKAELAGLAMRTQAKVEGPIRVVIVPDFDVTPCGGTHCTDSGQVGLVSIDRVERYKGGARISFEAGLRARIQRRQAAHQLRELSRTLGCAPEEIPAAYDKRGRELKNAKEELGTLRSALAERLVAELSTKLGEGPIIANLPGLGGETLRSVAKQLIRAGASEVLLASPLQDGCPVIALRSENSEFDCGAFLRRAAQTAGGRGGGRPDRAEGRFPAETAWVEVATSALAQ